MITSKQVIIERDVPCTLRDGIKLYANVYRPNDSEKYPVLLSRLPYNKNIPNFSHFYIDPIRAALDGYAVIIQDVRGRFASEGEFIPFSQEAKDGYDTVEWASKLAYSNGDVGMFGLSYYGFTQLAALFEKPPSLKAIFPAMTGGISEELFSRNGVFTFSAAETWFLESIAPDFLKRHYNESEYEEKMNEVIRDLDRIEEWYDYKPINSWPPIMKHSKLKELFEKYINKEFQTDLAHTGAYTLEDMDLPAYHLAGWYDNFLGSTIKNYQELKKSNHNQKLIIGPWAHGAFNHELGERSFGLNSSGLSIDGRDDMTSLHIKWFDYWMKQNNETLPKDEDPIKLFVMGINKWRSEKEWPLPRANDTRFYFHSDGNANLDKNAGMLTTQEPQSEPSDRFIFDPDNPVPTRGGGVLFYNGKNAGPYEQSEIEEREDVLVYSTEQMERPLEVTGWIEVVLWAATDAPNTDFTAKLVDVFPDGSAYNLTDGIVRASHVSQKDNIKDEIIKYKIDLWATSNVFLKGHKIRVEISSSNYPWYEVNPNTGETLVTSSKMVKAKQTIFHDKQYSSYIKLPVIPNE